MKTTETTEIEGTAQQIDAGEHDHFERLRREKAEFEEEAQEWAKEEGTEYAKNAPFVDLKETVDTGRMPEDCDHIRDGIRETGYDENQVIRGFKEGVRDVFESI